MSDTTLRTIERLTPGSETHACLLARAGRSAEASRVYRALADAVRDEERRVGHALWALPWAETRGTGGVVSDRCARMQREARRLAREARRLAGLSRRLAG